MREEERLAREVYLKIAELYPEDATAFTRIAASEQRHYEAVGTLLQRYGIDDPAENSSVGKYGFEELTTLYADLTKRAAGSLDEAAAVGIMVEETDIADLNAVLETDGLPADVERVMSNLKTGSEHHLEAFKALAAGETPSLSGRGMGNNENRRAGAGSGNGNRNENARVDGTGPSSGNCVGR